MPRKTKKSPTRSPSVQDIAKRAYEIYLDRAGADGSEVEDWLRAERELRAADIPPEEKAAKKAKGSPTVTSPRRRRARS